MKNTFEAGYRGNQIGLVNVHFDAGPLMQIADEIDATEQQVKSALRSTMAKATRWIRTRTTRVTSKELQIPQKVMRFRLKSLRFRAGEDFAFGGLWIGLNPIDLKFLDPKQGFYGVRTRYGKNATHPGAFMGARPGRVSRRLGGHVFRRVGKARLPIENVTHEIDADAYKALEESRIFAGFESFFHNTFEHELKWRTLTLK